MSLGLVLLTVVMVVAPIAPPARAEPGVPKGMTFFLHWVNDTEPAKTIQGYSVRNYFDTTLEFNDVDFSVTSSTTFNVQWWLVPALAADFRVSRMTLTLWMNASGGAKSSQITIGLYDVADALADPNGALVSETNFGNVALDTLPTLNAFTLRFPEYAFPAGHSIRVRIALVPGAFTFVTLYWDTPTVNSRVGLFGPDSMAITAVGTLDASRQPRTSFDPAAADQTMYVEARVGDPLSAYDIRWVNATVRDPFGAVLVDNATMARASGGPLDYENTFELAWNYSGQPVGVYTVGIWAVDNNGHNLYFFFAQLTYGDYDTYREGTFSVGERFYVNALVRDDAGAPLPGSLVEATQLSGTIAQGTTDGAGLVNLTLGSGSYVFVARWQDVPVAAVSATITGNVSASDPLLIDAAVYSPTLQLVDSRSVPLEGAAVTYTHPNGTTTLVPLLTDAAGRITLVRTAGGDYQVSVRWRGIEVAQTVWTIASSGTTVVAANVYYVDFHVVDSRGVGLSFASLVVREETFGLVLDFGVANATGWTTSRLPASTVDIAAYAKDVQVADVQGLTVAGDAVVTVTASVYYVGVTVQDPRGAPVGAATVTVRTADGGILESAITDGAGRAMLRVPAGAYALHVVWKGYGVYEDPAFSVTGDAQVALTVRVFYYTATLVDSHGVPLEAAAVRVTSPSGDVVAGGATDAQGHVTLRLPAGSFVLEAAWRNVPVLSTPLSVASDGASSYSAAVHYLTVTVVDREGRPLSGVIVSVDLAGTEAASLLDYTGPDGTAVFRLPAGEYNVTARLIATYLLTPIDETVHGTADLTAGDAPLAFRMTEFQPSLLSTNAFAISLLFVLLMAGMVAFVYLRYHRPRRPDDQEAPGKAGEGPGIQEGPRSSPPP